MSLTRGLIRSVVAVTVALSFASAENAFGQILHGITIAKGCVSPLCVGETTDCTVEIGHNDDFGDTIKVLSAWDIMDVGGDDVRIPAAGDLPIDSVEGNTTCTVGGALPCVIGPAGSVLGGLPGSDVAGKVRFRQNVYVIEADDPDTLRDQATVEWEDLCDDQNTSGCGGGITNPAPAPASTLVTRCDDANGCTTDTCTAGVCAFTPDCTSEADCDDTNACTAEVCTPEGCCESGPVTCDDGSACTDDSCDEATGCVFTPIVCEDDNACTENGCDPATGCVFVPIECGDTNDCTTDQCDPASGCQNVPDCTSEADCDDSNACTAEVCTAEGCCESGPVTCDDNNACTDDRCDPATGCVFTPIDCGDGNDCTTDSCDPASGCKNIPDCTSDADCDDSDACTTDVCTAEGCCEYGPVNCDDGDECTDDVCDPGSGCSNPPTDPPPPSCSDFAGCTPGFWKQKHHFQYWTNYNPLDSYEAVFGVDAIVLDGKTLIGAARTGGGNEAALGRHSVAALLNSASGEVNYSFSEAEVIAMVQTAYATGDFNGIKNILAAENELGCTVDKSGSNVTSRKGRSSTSGR